MPDLRNSATLVRLLIVLLISLFIFPLMTVSGVPYPEQIFQHFSWACPVILLILILLKVYFLQAFAPSLLRSQYSVVVSYVSNLLIFLFVDLVILKTDIWPLIQHFFLLTFLFQFHVHRSGTPKQPCAFYFRSQAERVDGAYPSSFLV
ncbi:hypothetical protein NEIFLAOT_00830 [Neisseria flavescens NRL30031/H210]|uniref:Uncharacterized protein n=1 Tax=Neisseria flavescens NRL30031/H210 TaxID=546264 RepID=C0ELM5_NEIFL|nr:hypothetical protein NEIFLAOT_00830 [Neisseria flavescens NRL30031/H210]